MTRSAAISGLSLLVLILAAPRPARAARDPDVLPSCTTGDGGARHPDILRKALDDAARLALGAVGYFNQVQPNPAPYETWFGPWDYTDATHPPGQIRGQVTGKTRLIQIALTGWKFMFACGDPDGVCALPDQHPSTTVAYVHKFETEEPLHIFLCPALWEESEVASQPESIAGTIVHEVSHFYRNATTGDEGADLDDPPKNDQSRTAALDRARLLPPRNQFNPYAYEGFFTSDPGGCEGSTGCRVSPAAGAHVWTLLPFCALALLQRRRLRAMSPEIRRVVWLFAAALFLIGTVFTLSACVRRVRAAVPVGPPPSVEESRLAFSLSAPPTIKLGDPLPVTTTLRNMSKTDTLYIDRTATIFWGFKALTNDMFRVVCNDVRMRYRGIIALVRHRQSMYKDYVELKPGEEIQATYDLATDYPPVAGTCTIHLYDNGFFDVTDTPVTAPKPQSRFRPVSVPTTDITVTVEEP